MQKALQIPSVTLDGLIVVKHGGRSVSSQCGSADVAEALHIPLCQSTQDVQDQLRRAPFAFLLAGYFNAVPPHVITLRRQLGIRTCFNVLSPLLNPVALSHQVMGVYDPVFLDQVPALMEETGVKSGMVLHSQDGMDEISISAPTDIAYMGKWGVRRFTLTPESVGLTSPERSHCGKRTS